MRNTIFGVIGILWGGAIIVPTLVRGIPSPSTSYGAGAFGGFLLGFALLGVGAWTLRRQRQGV